MYLWLKKLQFSSKSQFQFLPFSLIILFLVVTKAEICWEMVNQSVQVRPSRLESHVQPLKIKNGQKTANFFGKTCLEKMASNMNSLGGHVKDTHHNESL